MIVMMAVCGSFRVPQTSAFPHDSPGFELLDFRAEVSSFFTILADFALILLDLLALPLELVDEIVLDDGESG